MLLWALWHVWCGESLITSHSLQQFWTTLASGAMQPQVFYFVNICSVCSIPAWFSDGSLIETCPFQPFFKGVPSPFSTLDLETFNEHTAGLDSHGKIHHFCNHGSHFSPISAAVPAVACWVSKKGTHVISKGRYADGCSWSLAGSDKPKKRKGVRGSPAMNQNSIKQA